MLAIALALVVGALAQVRVLDVALFCAGFAAVSGLAGLWLRRRNRRDGVRPLGLRLLAIPQLIFAAVIVTETAISWPFQDGWDRGLDLLFASCWVVAGILHWRQGSREPGPGGAAPAVPASPSSE